MGWLRVEGCADPESDRWRLLEKELVRLNARYSTMPWASFGNEARASLLLESGFYDDLPIGEMGRQDEVEAPSLASFRKRPSIEPIAYSSWLRFAAWDIDMDWAIRSISSLTGRASRPRSGRLIKSPEAGLPGIEFAPVDQAGDWISAIEALRGAGKFQPLQEAALAFGLVMLYHPLDNGNGRLSRLLFHATLCNRLGVDAPFLALGPVAYKISYAHARMIQGVAVTRDWAAYLADFHDLLNLAVALENREQETLAQSMGVDRNG